MELSLNFISYPSMSIPHISLRTQGTEVHMWEAQENYFRAQIHLFPPSFTTAVLYSAPAQRVLKYFHRHPQHTHTHAHTRVHTHTHVHTHTQTWDQVLEGCTTHSQRLNSSSEIMKDFIFSVLFIFVLKFPYLLEYIASHLSKWKGTCSLTPQKSCSCVPALKIFQSGINLCTKLRTKIVSFPSTVQFNVKLETYAVQ